MLPVAVGKTRLLDDKTPLFRRKPLRALRRGAKLSPWCISRPSNPGAAIPEHRSRAGIRVRVSAWNVQNFPANITYPTLNPNPTLHRLHFTGLIHSNDFMA